MAVQAPRHFSHDLAQAAGASLQFLDDYAGCVPAPARIGDATTVLSDLPRSELAWCGSYGFLPRTKRPRLETAGQAAPAAAGMPPAGTERLLPLPPFVDERSRAVGSGAASTSGRVANGATTTTVDVSRDQLLSSWTHRHGVEIDALVRLEAERMRAARGGGTRARCWPPWAGPRRRGCARRRPASSSRSAATRSSRRRPAKRPPSARRGWASPGATRPSPRASAPRWSSSCPSHPLAVVRRPRAAAARRPRTRGRVASRRRPRPRTAAAARPAGPSWRASRAAAAARRACCCSRAGTCACAARARPPWTLAPSAPPPRTARSTSSSPEGLASYHVRRQWVTSQDQAMARQLECRHADAGKEILWPKCNCNGTKRPRN